MKIPCYYEDPRLVTTPVNSGIVLSFCAYCRVHSKFTRRWHCTGGSFPLRSQGHMKPPQFMNGLGHY